MNNIQIPWGQILLYLHTAAALACVVRVLYKQRNTGTAFAWLIILFMFPLFGVIAYLMLGEPRLGLARAKRAAEMNRFYGEFAERYLADIDLDVTNDIRPRYRGIAKVAADATGLGATRNNAMTLLSTTDEIVDAMLADIRAAEQSCLLAFYIIDPQGRIETLLNTVIEAAERGGGLCGVGRCGGQPRIFQQRLGRKTACSRHRGARRAAGGADAHAVYPQRFA